MNAGFRRLLALIVVFAAAFVAVSALRHWRAGGSWKDFLGGKPAGEFRPEKFTLAEKAPLETDDVELLSRLNGEYARLTKAVTPSVVSIGTAGVRTEKLLDNFGRARIRQYPTQGQGSGVIVSHEGHVVTNHHVIAGQQQIQITLHDGKTYPATLIGEDALLDIAVLKLEGAGEVQPLKFGDSAQVEVGQLVFAVGNPFGLGETVTQGIISAKERSISDNQRDLFQTDAAINPGNSGGPLVNLRGEIIGINAAIFSSDRTNPGFQGVGFSIPSNDVKDAISQILERGRPVRGFLGVQMADLDARIRSLLEYSGKDGAVVGAVTPGSPAEAAGLQPKDVIQSYNGESIHSMDQLFTLVQRSRANQEVPMAVWRAGQTLTLKAVIVESGSGTTAPAQTPPPVAQGRVRDSEEVLQALGIQVRDLSVPERMRGFRGVVVTELVPNALATDRLKAGDLVVAVNHARIGSANEFYMNLAASAAVQATAVVVFREGKQLRVDLPALPRDDSPGTSNPSGH
ncbi:trypsin-like peptidase domain-containing protein [Luteolibacter ambystomatis]|uniref:Trypsin-like peptidase domain-containing protein n=1 Tax=Luteolibacter ambystomatis TaxID=2824561 RepID=A0A975IYJ6_9BACT|nr:trypsin-like peptidase domain-containing protein [Luteolibacter ambystomatis]QUE50461.1 trypsin-like peptidase domain-containing protein [Luteolibacter ambystomatis]